MGCEVVRSQRAFIYTRSGTAPELLCSLAASHSLGECSSLTTSRELILLQLLLLLPKEYVSLSLTTYINSTTFTPRPNLTIEH